MSEINQDLNNQYKRVLLDGCAIDYRNRLSLCIINDYYRGRAKKITYQVHCDDSRCVFSKFYTDVDEAILQFLELKGKLKR